MMFYNVCDLILASNIPLIELLPVESQKSDCNFQFFATHNYSFEPQTWIQTWELPDQENWLNIAKTATGYLLRFPNFADFLVLSDGTTVQCYPVTDMPLETIKHLLLDQVIPLILNHRGKLVLHAGAVVLPEGAIAFLGASGFGKSTLTASLSQQGFPLLTDDCVLLKDVDEKILVIPSYPGLRLWPENAAALLSEEIELTNVAHYSSKRRLGWDTGHLNFTDEAVALRRLYVLSNPEEEIAPQEICITTLPPRDAYIEIFKHTFHLDITDYHRLAGEMSELSRLVTLGLVRKLSYPRELSLLPQVHEKILADVRQPDIYAKAKAPNTLNNLA